MALSVFRVPERLLSETFRDGKQETILLKYLLAMQRAAERRLLCWFLSFDYRRPTTSFPSVLVVIDEELYFHNQ